MSIQEWIAPARLAAMATLLIFAQVIAQEAQASDAVAAARPSEGVFQGLLGHKRVHLCVEAERSRYRYAGRAQSLDLAMAPTAGSSRSTAPPPAVGSPAVWTTA